MLDLATIALQLPMGVGVLGSPSVAAVRFGPVFSEFSRTLNWTLHPFRRNMRTLDRTYENVFEGSGSGSTGSEPGTEPRSCKETPLTR
jgi:hypothetical protein